MTIIIIYQKIKDVYWASKEGDIINWTNIIKYILSGVSFDLILFQIYLCIS